MSAMGRGLILLLVATLPWTARADDKAFARKYFKKGLAYAKRNKHRRAVESFLKAYALAPLPNIAYNHIITKMPCGLKTEVDFVMKKNLPVEICGKVSRQTDDFNCGAFMCMDFLQMMRFVNSGEGGLLALQEYRGTFVQV